jgi:hypothetical protein
MTSLRRRSDRAFLALALLVALSVATCGDGARLRRARSGTMARNAAIVDDLRLTDPCLFSDATFTRHLSLADAVSSMQDHPGALDHSQSGSMTGPPSLTVGSHAPVVESPTLLR